jgi:hypothetical protein
MAPFAVIVCLHGWFPGVRVIPHPVSVPHPGIFLILVIDKIFFVVLIPF